MHPRVVTAVCALILVLATASAAAQETKPEPESTRTAEIERAKAEKAKDLQPYVPGTAERVLNRAEVALTTQKGLHPFFENAYSGGGFTIGAGYLDYLGAYNTLDVRGSITFSGYKRIEAEYLAPRLLARQAALSVVGGWREATEVGYYGLGTATTKEARANYGFEQPYLSTTFTVRPANRVLMLRAGFEASQWSQEPGSGDVPSVEQIYTPATLPGLGSSVMYLHSQGTVGVDSRASPGYVRRGGFYGVSYHDFTDPDHRYGFTQVEYEALQHVPILRDTWVLSFRGVVSTTGTKPNEAIPFFMLPALGGGSSLRGYSSWRFRDRNSLKLQAEWRVMVNRFLDMALFYDAGKVTADAGDLSLSDLRSDFGLGVRFHGPLSTPLRIDFAHSDEGFRIVWASSAVF